MCCDTMEPCRKGAWLGNGTGSWISTGSWIGAGNKLVVIYVATKTAGQGRLSKFEPTERSMIGHSKPYQLT